MTFQVRTARQVLRSYRVRAEAVRAVDVLAAQGIKAFVVAIW